MSYTLTAQITPDQTNEIWYGDIKIGFIYIDLLNGKIALYKTLKQCLANVDAIDTVINYEIDFSYSGTAGMMYKITSSNNSLLKNIKFLFDGNSTIIVQDFVITPIPKKSVFNVLRKKLNCIRYGRGKYNNGKWIDSSTAEFKIFASIHGVDNETLETVPEGYRTSEVYIIYTDSKLQTAVIGISNPDVVIIDGDRYQVVKVANKSNIPTYAINHYEVIVVKVTEDEVEAARVPYQSKIK